MTPTGGIERDEGRPTMPTLEDTVRVKSASRDVGALHTRPTFSRALDRFAPAAPLVLRIAVGSIMAAHGLAKLEAGPTEVWGGFFAALGLPAPVILAWTVTAIELVGGICLVFGFLTRIAAMLFAGVMVGAIALVSAELGLRSGPQGPGADLNLALLAGAVAVVLLGPGRFALDARLRLDGDPSPRGAAFPANPEELE